MPAGEGLAAVAAAFVEVGGQPGQDVQAGHLDGGGDGPDDGGEPGGLVIAGAAASSVTGHDGGATGGDDQISDADLQIPLGDAPVLARGGQPCPPGIAPIRLSIAETARLASLAAHYTAGLITRARLAFALRWSARRRRHQATARWHHYSTRLLAVTGTG